MNLAYSATGINYNNFINSQAAAFNQEAADVRDYRDYYKGQHQAKPSDRIKEVIGISADTDFAINFMRIVVDAFAERLKVQSFQIGAKNETPAPKPTPAAPALPNAAQNGGSATPAQVETPAPEPEDPAKKISGLVEHWLQVARFDGKQKQIHVAAGRDARAFVICQHEKGRPCLYVNYAFDGVDGVRPFYGHDGTLLYAEKTWIVNEYESETGKAYRRVNSYFEDRVELWRLATTATMGQLIPLTPNPQNNEVSANITFRGKTYMATVIWLKVGDMPLGNPVIPFDNKPDGAGHATSDLNDLLTLQELINKTYLDMQEVADTQAYPLLWSTAEVVDENGDPVVPSPSNMLTVPYMKDGTAHSVNRLEAGDMTQLLNYYTELKHTISDLTGIPSARFTAGKQVAAEGTLKQQEMGLLSVVEDKQTIFGNAWENAVRYMLKLHKVYGNVADIPMTMEQLEDLPISTVWADPSPRSDSEKIANAKEYKDLGLPPEFWVPLLPDVQAGQVEDLIRDMKTAQSKQLQDELTKTALQVARTAQGATAQQFMQKPPANGGNGNGQQQPATIPTSAA